MEEQFDELKESSSLSNLNSVHDYWEDIDSHTAEGLASHEHEVFPILRNATADAETVFEIGTGSGRWLDALRIADVDAEFFGLDITKAVYDADCTGMLGDTRALPVQDNTFDCTFSIGVIEHFPESKQAVAEHARVTDSGGMVFMITPHLSPITLRRYVTYYLRGEHEQGSFEAIRGRNLTQRALDSWFRDAGLTDVQTGCYGDVWLPGVSQYDSVQRVLRRLAQEPFGNFVYAVGTVP